MSVIRPAGMSSDEDEFDDFGYVSVSPTVKKKEESKDVVIQHSGLRSVIEDANKTVQFHIAAENSDFSRMEELIRSGVSVNESRSNEWTPLMKACSQGQHEVVQFLLNNGADPNLHKELFTPLMACCYGNSEQEELKLICLRLLLDHGADVNARDKHKGTALIQSATSGYEQITNELLAVPGINVNCQDKQEWTALLYAVRAGHKGIVESLLAAGADPNLCCERTGITAHDVAEMKRDKELILMLKPHREPEEEETNSAPSVWNPVADFLRELPDADGNGGFVSEVGNVFASLGLGRTYDKIHMEMTFPDFLVVTDDELKPWVKVSPHRSKLLRAIREYHTASWRKSSLPHIPTGTSVSLCDFVNFMANVVKHLSIMHATLRYIHSRFPCSVKERVATVQELENILVDAHAETQKLRRILMKVSAEVEKVKHAGKAEADFVGAKTRRSSKRSAFSYCLWPLLGAAALCSAMFYRGSL